MSPIKAELVLHTSLKSTKRVVKEFIFNQIFSTTRINIENSHSLIIIFVSSKKRLNEI